MPMVIPTIEEFIATDIKRQGYWIVFNTVYNDVHAFHKPINDETGLELGYLESKDTDEVAREDFISYMKANFPSVRLVSVYDLVGLGYITWPYLGSIAIDMNPGDAVYQALSDKYNDPESDPAVNNAVLWTMKLDDAIGIHEKRVKSYEDW